MFKKFSRAIFTGYKGILWIMGFRKGEYITFMWRREEARLGVLWFVFVAITQSCAIIFLDSWHSALRIWVQMFVCILIAVVFWHVATGTIPPSDDPK